MRAFNNDPRWAERRPTLGDLLDAVEHATDRATRLAVAGWLSGSDPGPLDAAVDAAFKASLAGDG
jgi:hypothetical protein